MELVPEIVPEASPHQEMEHLYSELFKKLRLDTQQTASAQEILLRDVNSRRVRDHGSGKTWPGDVAFMAQRDAALRGLLKDASQRAIFDQNATSLQRTLEALRRQ